MVWWWFATACHAPCREPVRLRRAAAAASQSLRLGASLLDATALLRSVGGGCVCFQAPIHMPITPCQPRWRWRRVAAGGRPLRKSPGQQPRAARSAQPDAWLVKSRLHVGTAPTPCPGNWRPAHGAKHVSTQRSGALWSDHAAPPWPQTRIASALINADTRRNNTRCICHVYGYTLLTRGNPRSNDPDRYIYPCCLCAWSLPPNLVILHCLYCMGLKHNCFAVLHPLEQLLGLVRHVHFVLHKRINRESQVIVKLCCCLLARPVAMYW